MLAKMKQSWIEKGLPLKQQDTSIIRVISKVKERFKNLRKNEKTMGLEEKQRHSAALKSVTVNLAPANYEQAILSRWEVDLSGVSPMLFISAAKLSELHISNTVLTQEQIASLWTAFKNNTECDIKSISMSGINLASVEVEALVGVASKVCKIDLSNTELTDEQITALVSSLRENQEIQEVDLSDNTLSGVDPDLLATAMSKTRKLSLVNTGLTVVQVEKLLNLIAANCPMESLNLSANMLSMVETELMAQAVNKLRDVTLIDTNLSVNQVLRISHIF